MAGYLDVDAMYEERHSYDDDAWEFDEYEKQAQEEYRAWFDEL